jgi:hypothetical protein
MNWLDSGKAWPCNATEGDPSIIRLVVKGCYIQFHQVGEIRNTYDAK